ncbi:MAG: FMN-binding protein [Fluviibacter sp.]
MFKRFFVIAIAVIGLISGIAYARTFMSIQDAQKLMFPNAKLTKVPVIFSDAQLEEIRDRSGVREPEKGDQIWRTPNGGWFMIQQVVGKHEMITYAIGINPDGTVKHIEILEYVESYGYEVAEQSWLKQFYGRTVHGDFKLGRGVDSISGATLSCKHLADGVKRDLVAYDTVLKNLK